MSGRCREWATLIALRSGLPALGIVGLLACQARDDFPSTIPVGPGCDLVSCESTGAACGPVGNGCGGKLSCGGCEAGEVCGGGDGTPFTCGVDPCVPRDCAAAGAECGRVADGCGGLTADCGDCPTGEVCGVGPAANRCAAPPCEGLCLQQQACSGQPKTTITGVVTAPGHDDPAVFGAPDPIFGALVFVPNGAAGPPTWGVEAFSAGVACETCSTVVTGAPLVTATTGVDGRFTLTDAPCGTSIPLVIQLGRWRRQITIPSVACCATTTLANRQTHLPRSRGGEPGDVRSDIPLMAVSTGAVDTAHCVLRKMGIEDAEFTNPSGSGRVRLYRDTGAKLDGATPPAANLYGSTAELSKYDIALFECVGDRVPKTPTEQQRVIAFADAGGRVLATHFSYVWLTDSDGTDGSNDGPAPFSQTASWRVDQAVADQVTATVDRTAQGDPLTQTRRTAFADWLQLVGASTTLGSIPLTFVRKDLDEVSPVGATKDNTPAQQWLFSDDPALTGPLQFTFDTPVAYPPSLRPSERCGRVLFNDFHVTNSIVDGDSTFPTECSDGPMTPQEKTLEFMLFDLASCVGPPRTPCTPRSCAQQGLECGSAGTGCDDDVILDCGECSNGRTCGGGGFGSCGTGLCVPRTCEDVGATCGLIGDGCGGTAECGVCPAGTTCGGGDVPNTCGHILL